MLNLLDIVGQDEALALLERGLTGARRPHAYLFAGPVGVGRRTTAAALAKTLLCESPVTVPNTGRLPSLAADQPLRQACGRCVDCRMMDGNSHPDYHMVTKELAAFHEDADVRKRVMQELGIDVVRSFLIAPANRRAARNRGKVFVVREAELMSEAAQNAMLKTLEEPPPGVTIVLMAEQASQMLPTTLSRCSVLSFRPLPRDFVVRKLVERDVSPDEAGFWAHFTDGSVGRALALAGEGMYEVKRDLLSRLAAMDVGGDAELGDYLAKKAEELAIACVKATKTESSVELSKNLATRQATGKMLELIASVYIDAIALSSGAARPLVHADQIAEIQAIAGRFSLSQLAEIIDQLARFEQFLWRNVSAKTIWDNVVITCASAAPLTLGD